MTRAAALLILAASPAIAVDIERETYRVLGWNDACSVAIERFAYPKLGQAFYGEPVTTRVGVITIEPGQTLSGTTWHLEADGPRTWKPAAVKELEAELAKSGYDRPGFEETIRVEPPVDAPGVREVILSSATLHARSPWPAAQWRWAAAHYNPLGTCALLVFERRQQYTRYLLRLARIDNPRARMDRAHAHMANALILFDRGDPEQMLAEAGIAARLAPEKAAARYHHARALALAGDLDQAASELGAAVKLDKRYSAKARDERDFESLRERPDFQGFTQQAQ